MGEAAPLGVDDRRALRELARKIIDNNERDAEPPLNTFIDECRASKTFGIQAALMAFAQEVVRLSAIEHAVDNLLVTEEEIERDAPENGTWRSVVGSAISDVRKEFARG